MSGGPFAGILHRRGRSDGDACFICLNSTWMRVSPRFRRSGEEDVSKKLLLPRMPLAMIRMTFYSNKGRISGGKAEDPPHWN